MSKKELEDNFRFEKEKQQFFNKIYKSKGWAYKRIYGKENKFYDCVVLVDERWVKVEEKYRRRGWPDLLVEIIQDTETNSPGWLYYTQAD